uniref:Ribosomal RNA-processing protein 42 n=1 Tax=Odontella aurita TaxID=265563 RepID=A0A7S4MU72_9STRA|mmetsp:Transcript_33001/g.98205  ORF Transcript_33001/g.98205 Transcript_33001/m.98205 type:complete len:384 (+) Transcript_33001:147-1298(+)
MVSSDPHLSPSEAEYLLAGFSGIRIDGRGPADYRPYALDSRSRSLPPHSSRRDDPSARGGASTAAVVDAALREDHGASSSVDPPLVLSHGSSRVSLPGGGADVLCSVRAELVRPSPAFSDRGSVDVRVELLGPSPSSHSRSRRRTEEAELTAALQRLVCPHAADLRGLCIVPGRYAWRLACDVSVLSSDGNALDAAAMALRAAVRGTLLPSVMAVDRRSGGGGGAGVAGSGGKPADDLVVDGDMADAAPPLGADDCPVVVTVFIMESLSSSASTGGGTRGKVSRALLLDARSEEERCASTSVAVGVDRSGRICGVYKRRSPSSSGGGGNGTLPVALLGEVAATAAEGARRVLHMMDGEGSWRGGEKLAGGGAEDLLGGHIVIQ